MEEKRQAHVRPRVRSKRAVVAPSLNDIPDKTDMDELLEHTRQRIQSQLEISSTRKHVGKQAASSISQVAPPTSAPLKAPTAKPKKGILKTSKYSVQPNETSTKDTNVNVNDSSRPLVKEKPRAAVKDLVVERQEPATNEPAALFADALAVEGHTPKTRIQHTNCSFVHFSTNESGRATRLEQPCFSSSSRRSRLVLCVHDVSRV